jgi:hypothetical protein
MGHWRRGGFLFLKSIKGFFEKVVHVVELAALNLFPDALFKLWVMDFDVHSGDSFNSLLVSRT